MQLHLDRNVPISLTEQIKGQITYAISYGMLKAGDRLPSVREMSAALTVAPMTISHAYRALCQEGLLITRSGVGTFVADMASASAPGGTGAAQLAQGNLQQVIDGCVRQALLLGHTVDELRAAFLAFLDQNHFGWSARTLAMVGNFKSATESYAREVEAILRDVNVTVVPLLLDDLKNNFDAAMESLRGVKLAITIPPRLQEVRSLLEPHHCYVVAVAFRASAETRRRLSLSLHSRRRAGLVSTYPEFLQSLVDVVSSYGLLQTPPLCALITQEERVRELLRQIDVLVYASGSERVLEWLPPEVEAIEYLHSPEPDSVNRLRPLIGALHAP